MEDFWPHTKGSHRNGNSRRKPDPSRSIHHPTLGLPGVHAGSPPPAAHTGTGRQLDATVTSKWTWPNNALPSPSGRKPEDGVARCAGRVCWGRRQASQESALREPPVRLPAREWMSGKKGRSGKRWCRRRHGYAPSSLKSCARRSSVSPACAASSAISSRRSEPRQHAGEDLQA